MSEETVAASTVTLPKNSEEAPSAGRRTESLTQSDVDAVMESLPANDYYPKPGIFQALAYRNFRLFFYGQLVSVAGTWMQDVAQKWLVWELTHSATWLGIVSGANAIPFVVFAIWGGQIADRYSRRRILLWTQTGAMLLAFLLAFLATKSLSPISLHAWHVVVIAALSGIVNAFNMPAQQAFVTDMVEDRKVLSNAIALNSLRFNIARVLGPALAGVVLVKVGSAACFALNGVSFVAVIISLQMMRLPVFKPRAQNGSVFDGFRYIWQSKRVLRIILLTGSASVLTWPLSTLFPVFADLYHVGSRGYSAMMAANGVGAAIAGLALAGVGARFESRVKVYGGAFLFGLSLLLLAASRHYYLALACLVLCGFAMIFFGISSQTRIQEEVPDALRGRVMAVYSLVFNGLFSVGGLEIGFLAERLHAPGAVGVNATLALLVTAVLFAWSQSDHRRADKEKGRQGNRGQKLSDGQIP